MTTVSTIRTGLATNLATITGLRTSATMPDAINPPVAIVVPEGITFDSAMARGMDEYSFTIMVIVGRADARTYTSITAGDVVYLAAEFAVTVYA